MLVDMRADVKRVVILDVSGIYSQIHNEGYFEENQLKDIQEQYSDTRHWRVLVLD